MSLQRDYKDVICVFESLISSRDDSIFIRKKKMYKLHVVLRVPVNFEELIEMGI